MSNEAVTDNVVVTLTESAVEQVRVLRDSKPEDAGKPLRIYVEKGGCSGMQYGMVFDEPRDGDAIARFGGIDVLVDAFSAEYLRGTVIDFQDTLNDGGFKMSNPNATHNCGCGRSFDAGKA